MTTSTTARSPNACLDCGAPLVERQVAGEPLSECTACGSLRLARSSLNRLRGRSPDAHPLLAASPLDPPSDTPPALGRIRKCPVCAATVFTHPFGGGNVKVETCEPCEIVFLKKRRLAAIVKEAREGIQMSDDARATLQHTRLLAAGNRFSAAEFGIGTAFLVVLLVFFRIVVRTGFNSVAMVVGAVIAGGLLFYLQVKWRSQRSDAAEKMERIAAEELARLRAKEALERGALPPKAATLPPSSGPKDSPARVSNPVKSASGGRTFPCPVCRAPLPPGSTSCSACDSDFG